MSSTQPSGALHSPGPFGLESKPIPEESTKPSTSKKRKVSQYKCIYCNHIPFDSWTELRSHRRTDGHKQNQGFWTTRSMTDQKSLRTRQKTDGDELFHVLNGSMDVLIFMKYQLSVAGLALD